MFSQLLMWCQDVDLFTRKKIGQIAHEETKKKLSFILWKSSGYCRGG